MKRTIVVAAIVVLLSFGFVTGRITSRQVPSPQDKSHRVLYYVDPMHPAYRSDKPGIAPDCGMALEPVYEGENNSPQVPLQEGAVTLSPERQQLSGIRVSTVTRSEGLRTVRTTARVVPDDNHLYRIQAGFEGWIQMLKENPPGTLVKKDQVLATLYSPEIRTAEQTYAGFMSSIQRIKSGASPTDMKSIEDSERVNEEQLRLLGMGNTQIKQLAATHHVVSSLDLVAPADGIVLARGISPHQRFEKGTELYRIADLTKVWIVADAHGDESTLLPGTRVKVNLRELGKTIDARMSTATPLFDEASRTLKLRMEADNPGLFMRPDMFVDVEFQVKVPPGLSIPAEAVLDSGMRKIVYVESSQGVFEPRPITVAGAYGDRVTVASGIAEGDRVVVAGNFLLDSESRMRSAGPANAGMVLKPAMGDSKQREAKVAIESKAHSDAKGVTDPVCGMTLKPQEVAFKEAYMGKTFSFCSDSCRKKFLAEPAKYAGAKAARAPMAQDQAAHSHD